MNTSVTVDFINTNQAPPDLRCQFWENYNNEQLIGLRCTSYAEEGFIAAGKNVHINDFGIAYIKANEHVIERDAKTVKATPKQSVFFSLGLSKSAFFYQGQECFSLSENDMIVYQTDKPYLFGFSSNMQQLTFDLPIEIYQQIFGQTKVLDKPEVIKSTDRKQHFLTQALRHLGMSYLQDPQKENASAMQSEVFALLDHLHSQRENHANSSTLSFSYLISAEQYFLANLHNPNLSCEEVAQACGLSTRHLLRIFSQVGTTPKQFLLTKRIELAVRVLTSKTHQHLSIAEIAYQCGFSNQAHFSRVFKALTGHTPKAYKELDRPVPLLTFNS